MLGDKDTSLFPALRQGVPTGCDADIPRSYTFRPGGKANRTRAVSCSYANAIGRALKPTPLYCRSLLRKKSQQASSRKCRTSSQLSQDGVRLRLQLAKSTLSKPPTALPAGSLTIVYATRIRAALSPNSSPYPACKTYKRGRGTSLGVQLGCQGCSQNLSSSRTGQRPAGTPPTGAAFLLRQGLPIWGHFLITLVLPLRRGFHQISAPAYLDIAHTDAVRRRLTALARRPCPST